MRPDWLRSLWPLALRRIGAASVFLASGMLAAMACVDAVVDVPQQNKPDAGSPPSSTDGATDVGTVDQMVPPAAIAIANSSFELPATGPNTFVTNAPPAAWQAYGNAVNFGARTVGVLNPNNSRLYLDAVPDGQNVGVVFLLDNLAVATEAGMEQTLTELLAVNTTYTLRVDVGNINPVQGLPYDFTGFPGYRIELLAGGSVIASDNGTLQPGEGRFQLSTIVAPIGMTHPRAGQALGIRLINVDGPAGIEVNFDNVRLSAQRR